MKMIWMAVLIVSLGFTGCSAGVTTKNRQATDGATYTKIDQEKAKEMMKQNKDLIIVDVRTQEEYEEGHIPGAVSIPNETIADEQPEKLPDFEQIVLVYCRSGNRSQQAAQKLANIGYSNVYDFGGINSWTGDIAK